MYLASRTLYFPLGSTPHRGGVHFVDLTTYNSPLSTHNWYILNYLCPHHWIVSFVLSDSFEKPKTVCTRSMSCLQNAILTWYSWLWLSWIVGFFRQWLWVLHFEECTAVQCYGPSPIIHSIQERWLYILALEWEKFIVKLIQPKTSFSWHISLYVFHLCLIIL